MTTMATSLIMTLHVGAAFHDGTSKQRTALREGLKGGAPSVLERYRRHEVDEAAIYGVLDDVMGSVWNLTGDYARQVRSLAGERECGRCHDGPPVNDSKDLCRRCIITHRSVPVESVTVRRRGRG
jgi:hypothetical protein